MIQVSRKRIMYSSKSFLIVVFALACSWGAMAQDPVVSNDTMRLTLEVEEASYLGTNWMSRTPPYVWEAPASSNVYFYRVRGR